MKRLAVELRRWGRNAGHSATVTLLLAIFGAGLSLLALFENPTAGVIVVAALLLATGVFAGFAVYAAGEGLYSYVKTNDVWDIEDPTGQLVVNTRERKVRYLQDEVFAIRDYA